jgi:small subunit ribosomal protein S9
LATAITENLGTGKRKTAVARVHLRPGKGGFSLNDQSLDEFFGGHETLKMIVRQPFVATETPERSVTASPALSSI